MELSPELKELVQKHLGQQALAIQAQQGRGAWFATKGTQASYIPVATLPSVFGGGSYSDFQDLLDMVDEFDPARQVVVIFNADEELQIVATVDIEGAS